MKFLFSCFLGDDFFFRGQWGVTGPIFLVLTSFGYGQIRLHPVFYLPTPSGSGLKVWGGGWVVVVCKPILVFIFRPLVELNNWGKVQITKKVFKKCSLKYHVIDQSQGGWCWVGFFFWRGGLKWPRTDQAQRGAWSKLMGWGG